MEWGLDGIVGGKMGTEKREEEGEVEVKKKRRVEG